MLRRNLYNLHKVVLPGGEGKDCGEKKKKDSSARRNLEEENVLMSTQKKIGIGKQPHILSGKGDMVVANRGEKCGHRRCLWPAGGVEVGSVPGECQGEKSLSATFLHVWEDRVFQLCSDGRHRHG